MAWIVLFVAGLMEIGWAIGLKYTDGFIVFSAFLFGVRGLEMYLRARRVLAAGPAIS